MGYFLLRIKSSKKNNQVRKNYDLCSINEILLKQHSLLVFVTTHCMWKMWKLKILLYALSMNINDQSWLIFCQDRKIQQIHHIYVPKNYKFYIYDFRIFFSVCLKSIWKTTTWISSQLWYSQQEKRLWNKSRNHRIWYSLMSFYCLKIVSKYMGDPISQWTLFFTA